ncbi:hypothetical protein FEK34_29490 [Nocardia cyriacigeorgica]|uniref:Uncharacterized protein n=1 Tax=Nocardia cyriacigeorgica TaxID=135487 RepID=A0A5R8N929_9NOCA|nr:hypothetical protein FEK34_29490 [Nocardia cyriacigeorgica]
MPGPANAGGPGTRTGRRSEVVDEHKPARRPGCQRSPVRRHGQDMRVRDAERKVELGSCGRPYGTGCQHEHACVRRPMLHVDPRDDPPPRRAGG